MPGSEEESHRLHYGAAVCRGDRNVQQQPNLLSPEFSDKQLLNLATWWISDRIG